MSGAYPTCPDGPYEPGGVEAARLRENRDRNSSSAGLVCRPGRTAPGHRPGRLASRSCCWSVPLRARTAAGSSKARARRSERSAGRFRRARALRCWNVASTSRMRTTASCEHRGRCLIELPQPQDVRTGLDRWGRRPRDLVATGCERHGRRERRPARRHRFGSRPRGSHPPVSSQPHRRPLGRDGRPCAD